MFFCFKIYFAKSQNIKLTVNSLNGISEIEKEISEISKILVKNCKRESNTNNYRDLFHLQLLTSEYKDATNSINNYITSYTIDELRTGNVFIYLVYADAKNLKIKSDESFGEVFEHCFLKLYRSLRDDLKPGVSRSISNDLSWSSFKDNFVDYLNDLKDRDSITVNQGKKLCRLYNTYKVYLEVGDLATSILEREDEKQFEIQKDVVVRTKDGAEVTALVMRKRGVNTPLPAVFLYNIYAGSYDYMVAKRAAIHGYVGVSVNTRGKRLSKDDISPFEFDGEDAYDIIDWVSKHNWCDSKIGMMGGSYLGFSQWSATKNMHPALKTIVPQVAVGVGVDYPMHNNIFMGYMLQWIKFVTNNKFTDRDLFNDFDIWEKLYLKYYLKGYSIRDLDTLYNGSRDKIFQKWLDHPNYDEYWQSMIPYKEDFRKINIPVLTTTGYYDDDQTGALYYFKNHYKYNRNAQHYLLIGPYSHSGGQHYSSRELREYKIDSVANISMHKLAFEWFDYVLKGEKKPEILKDKVNYQVMGTNRWEHANSLTSMNESYLKLFLSDKTIGDHFMLSKTKSKNIGFINYQIDLSERNEKDLHHFTVGSLNNILSEDIRSQNAIKFVSDIFESDLTINGTFEGKLSISINKRDMDVLVQLYEIKPDGTYFFLSESLLRASYAKNREKRELLKPGLNYKIPIKQSFMVSKKISKGSRIMVLASVNKSKYWEVNYGTGKPVCEENIEDATTPLLVKWYNDSFIKVGVNYECH